jgi:hypothetical protein
VREHEVLAIIVAAGVVVSVVLFVLPVGRVAAGPRVPQRRVDERDIMYARVELKPDTPAYDAYYSMRPERKAADDRMRSLPGLLSPDSLLADPLAFAAADVAFGVTMGMVGELEGEPSEDVTPAQPKEITPYLKGLARYWGAAKVGVTEVQDYHLYSHRGMDQDRFGEPIAGEYRFAVALASELDPAMLAASPQAPAPGHA